MPIYFALYPNNLTEDPGDYYAVVQSAQIRTNADIADRIISMGSTVTRADILSVLNDRDEAVRAMLLDGDRVNTSLVSLYVTIKGTFDGPMAPFDPSRHQFNIVSIPIHDLMAWVQNNARAQQVEADRPEPEPLRFVDAATGEINSVLQPNNVANLEGRRLKFDAGDPLQGVFFVAADGAASRVEIVAKNSPSELIFVTPVGLTAGNYTLEVRAMLRGTKEMRTGRLAYTLTVS
jgi:hypothetical protein